MLITRDNIVVKVLGTGTSLGVPVITCTCEVCTSDNPKDFRLRSSILIETKGKAILIDCGPDFRAQMLKAKATRLDAILFTHEHRDHTAGLDDIRAFNYMLKSEVPIYGREQVLKALRTQFDYVFTDTKYEGAPQVMVNQLNGRSFNIDDVKVIPIEVMHSTMPVFGFRVGDFAYITDANLINEKELEKLLGLDVLIINALRKKKHFSHYSVEEAVEIIERLQPKKAYLTHLSHLAGKHDDLNAELPDNIEIAFDGLELLIT